jgi:hypothetical protein
VNRECYEFVDQLVPIYPISFQVAKKKKYIEKKSIQRGIISVIRLAEQSLCQVENYQLSISHRKKKKKSCNIYDACKHLLYVVGSLVH